MPKFSIIVPLHNSESFCRKCLDSIKQQTFTDYELIIICDRCEDNSEAIAHEYTDKVFVTDYGNDGMARNVGLDNTQGEWILFLDDDDWWLHEYVLEQINSRVGKENEDMLCFSFIFKGWCYAQPEHPSGGMWIAIWCKCWRRSFIDSTRFPNKYPADLYFHQDILKKHPRLAKWDMPMYYYNYMRKGSQSDIYKEF